MDLFAWTQLPNEQFSSDLVSDELTSTHWIADAQSAAWQWDGSCTTNYAAPIEPLPFIDTSTNSPDSYQSSESYRASSFDGSYFDSSPTSTSLDIDVPGSEVKVVAGRPRCPVSTGRDPNENRIQRRRTQNRNSQRVYRQRRIEERNEFEVRATTAEATSEKLRVQVGELETDVAKLNVKCEVLEAENVELRTGSRHKSPKRSTSRA